MTTKLYFHAASNALSGTFPTGEQATAAADWITTGANTLRAMNTTIGVSQTSLAGNSLASTSTQNAFMGFFCSPALSGAQTVGGSTNTRTINIANAESNLNMNFGFGLGFNEYVWRPGTGAKVGTVIDGSGVGGGGIEPTAAASEQVIHTSGFILTGSGVAAQDGDVIIVEVWMNIGQGMATSYTGTFYFDGTTENTTNNAVVSNHASYYQLSETLAFQAPATNATVNLTGQSATASVGSVTPSYNKTVSLTGQSSTASVGTVIPTVVVNDTVNLTGQSATASVGTVTETFSGQKTLTGQSATASVGAVTRQIDNNPALTGKSATASGGTVTETRSSTATLTGQSMTASVGTVTPTVAGNTTVNLTGLTMTASVGTVTVLSAGASSGPPSGAPGGKRRVKFRGRFYDAERDRYQLARDVQDWLEEKPAQVAETKPVKVKVAKKTIVLPPVELTEPEIVDFEAIVRELNLRQQAVTDYIAGLRALAQRIEMDDEEDAIALLLAA